MVAVWVAVAVAGASEAADVGTAGEAGPQAVSKSSKTRSKKGLFIVPLQGFEKTRKKVQPLLAKFLRWGLPEMRGCNYKGSSPGY
jgi:hypothetical protein